MSILDSQGVWLSIVVAIEDRAMLCNENSIWKEIVLKLGLREVEIAYVGSYTLRDFHRVMSRMKGGIDMKRAEGTEFHLRWSIVICFRAWGESTPSVDVDSVSCFSTIDNSKIKRAVDVDVIMVHKARCGDCLSTLWNRVIKIEL